MKTWVFAILSPVEVFAEIAYVSGMKNLASHSEMLSRTLPGRVCFCYRLRYKLRKPEKVLRDWRKGCLKVKLKDELLKIVVRLDKAGIDYALCGGLAVAVHGHPRMTKDIDILIRPESLEAAKAALAEIAIKVVSKKGLITMKNVAGRPQDFADIDALSATMSSL